MKCSQTKTEQHKNDANVDCCFGGRCHLPGISPRLIIPLDFSNWLIRSYLQVSQGQDGAAATHNGSLGDLIEAIPPEHTAVTDKVTNKLQPAVDDLLSTMDKLPSPVNTLSSNAVKTALKHLVERVKEIVEQANKAGVDVSNKLGSVIDCTLDAVNALAESYGQIGGGPGGITPLVPNLTTLLGCTAEDSGADGESKSDGN